jgi:uncharacterized membrane protein
MNQIIGAVLIDTFTYKALLAVHVLATIAAFGPLLVVTILGRVATKRPGEAGAELVSVAVNVNKRTSMPALVVAVVAGIGLVVKSEKIYTFEQGWISAAFTIVILIALLSWFVLQPALQRLQLVAASKESSQDELRSARARVAMSTGVIHLGMLALVVLMVWKPGGPL